MGLIDWAKMPNQTEFDRVVEMLLVAEHGDQSGEAYAVDGRGGDGGIDISIRVGGVSVVVQLKFFPEGFSGGFAKTRRPQILSSFRTAVDKHDPDEWWLVVPRNLTPGEREYVMGLPGLLEPPRVKPKIRIFDVPQLDALAAKHPDLVSYYKKDELLHAAEMYNQERALVVN